MVIGALIGSDVAAAYLGLVGFPAISAVIAGLAPQDLRGRYQGAMLFAFSIGMTLAPVSSGFVSALHCFLGAGRRRQPGGASP